MSTAIALANHPCFSAGARHRYGRVHLPVAPACNMQCRFCNRRYDCVNESRPGVTSTVLTPKQALAYVGRVVADRPELAVVGIAGPGDPFANPDETLETLRLVRGRFPAVILCVATNGLGIGRHIEELVRFGVSHITMTITAIAPEIAARIYAWVRDDKRVWRGRAAGELLIGRQLDALRGLKAAGMTVKINSIIIPGINDAHLSEIAKTVGELGADVMNCVPMVPVKGAELEHVARPDGLTTRRLRSACALHLPQMSHCARCRADAVGLLDEPLDVGKFETLRRYAAMTGDPADDASRPRVAVASLEGTLVNQHLGEASRFLIYEPDPANAGLFTLTAIRPAPAPGSRKARWEALADLLTDCRALLVSAAGPSPTLVLEQRGLNVVEMEGLVDEGLRAIYANEPVPAALRRRFTACGNGLTCKGSGTGCG